MLLNWGVVRLSAVVYFIQGSLGIAGIALPLYLRAQGFSVSKITFIVSVVSIPWFLKIFYGAISDAFPIFGLRRKPYLIICAFLSSLGWILLSILPPDEKWLMLAMITANLGLAATDVITDGLVVEYSRKGSAQTYQAIAWGARSLGSVASGFTGGILAAKVSAQTVFLITAVLPLISLLATVFLREKRFKGTKRDRNIFAPIIKSFWCIIHGDLKWFVLLLFIISSSVAIGTPLFFYMREILKFDEIFLGVLNSVTWFGAIIGCFVFVNAFRRVPLHRALYCAVVVGFFDILMTLAIKDHASAFIVSLFLGILGYMVLLPLFSASAALAHGTGVEGSLFATLMSLFNLGQALASFAGGLLFEQIGLKPLIVVTAIFGLSALFIISRFKHL